MNYDYAMNLMMNDSNNGFCPLSYLDSPFQDFYVFEGYETFSETEESSFASSNTNHHHFHISTSSFHSPNPQETQNQSSHFQEYFNGEYCSWSCEELMPNDNKKSKSRTVSKGRIKWTKELHQQFINCVDQLGGAQKATPKQLFHLMETKGLTLIHIKSHLQKYRISQHIQEFSKGKTNKKELMQGNHNIGKQLMEAVRQQLETQSTLNEQLEVQKNLMSAMEEQMKKLRGVLELRRKPIVFRNE